MDNLHTIINTKDFENDSFAKEIKMLFEQMQIEVEKQKIAIRTQMALLDKASELLNWRSK